MKNLTKTSLILLLTLFCYQTNAQNIGIKGGFNFANMLDKDDDGTYSNDYKLNPGAHLGLTVDIPMEGLLSFESGLLFSTKGTKLDEEEQGFSLTAKINLYYIDIPLLLKASHELKEGLKIFGVFGPYVGFGMAGKVKAKATFQGQTESESEDISWGNDEDSDNFKRLDMGLTFGAGVEIKSITIGMSYDLGLANISTFQDNGATVKNRVLKLSVGYPLGTL